MWSIHNKILRMTGTDLINDYNISVTPFDMVIPYTVRMPNTSLLL